MGKISIKYMLISNYYQYGHCRAFLLHFIHNIGITLVALAFLLN